MDMSHRRGSQATVRVRKPLVALLVNTLSLVAGRTTLSYICRVQSAGVGETQILSAADVSPGSSEGVGASQRDKRELSHVLGHALMAS